MNLTALVFTLCSMQSMQCVNYVAKLYASPTACRIAALGTRELRQEGPVFVRCVPTTK